MPPVQIVLIAILVVLFGVAGVLLFLLRRARADVAHAQRLVVKHRSAQEDFEHELARMRHFALRTDHNLQATFDNAAIGLAHVSPSGRFLRVNRHLCEMLGYTAERLLEKNFEEITYPEDLPADWALIHELLDKKRQTYTLEKRYIHESGKLIWVNLTVSLMRRPDGTPDYFIAAIEHIDARKAAEQKLHQRDQQLAAIFREGLLGDWVWDLASDQVTASSPVWKMFGFEGQSGSGPMALFQDRYNPEDAPKVAAVVDAAVTAKRPLDVEFRVLWPDGGVRWISRHASIAYAADGQPAQLHGIDIDITRRKEVEAALARYAEEFRQLVDVLPQMIWLAKADGAVEFFNERWYEYTAQDSVEDLESAWQRIVHPEDLPECLQRWRRSLESGEIFEVEFRLRAADGSYQWFLGRGLPMRDDQRRVIRWFGSCTDIDQIKQAEAQARFFNQQLEMRVGVRTSELVAANERLSQTRARLQLVLDSASQVAIIALDRNGVIQLFNAGAETILGPSAAEVIGRESMHRFEHPVQQEERARLLSERLGRPVSTSEIYSVQVLPAEPYTRETVLVRADGRSIHVSLASAPMVDSQGIRTGTLQIATDISRRKELEAQLTEQTRRAEAANRAKSEFLAVMSHEIRTPMNAIVGMADLLWETELTPVQKEYVDRCRHAGANLLSLINDILDLSKIESGRFELERIEFDLEEVFHHVLELMMARASAKGLVLAGRIDPEVPRALVGDPARLEQVLLNLVGNAIKFTEHGEVVFSVQPHTSHISGHLLFQVRDTGIGIPPENLALIFEDFTQADSTITRRFGGTGLGLGIARRLVRRFGGELRVASTPGQGTVFSFDAIFGLGHEQPTASSAIAQSLSGRRVLIIDNNETNRLIFAEMCASWGMLPVKVDSADASLATLMEASADRSPFSLVIVDRRLTDADGFALATRVRDIDPGVPIIITTSDDQPGDATRAQSLGLCYARKPLRRSELIRLVSSALAPQLDAAPTEASKAPARAPKAGAAARLLVAEDSEDNRFLIEAYLGGDASYQLTAVENGKDAVERFRSESFDLVLMDVQMPILDGLSAAAAIRQYEQAAHRSRTPILALTAHGRPEDLDRSLAAGCDGHLLKPITKMALLEAVDHFLSNKARIPRLQVNASVGGLDDQLVRIPPGLQAAARRYIRTRQTEVARLQALLDRGAFNEVRVLAHNMKGAGQSFGFPPLSHLGGEMESAAQSSDVARLREQLARLKDYVQYAAAVVLKEE